VQTKLKIYHWLLSLLTITVCLFLFIGFGWSAFATITERPGLNGSMYSYYHLTIPQYTIYTGLVAMVGLCTILFISFYLFKKEAAKLTKLFWRFLIFILVVVACEIYLQTRFVGKG
jgi:hypothetical protein